MDQRTLEETPQEQLYVFPLLPHYIQTEEEDDLQGDVPGDCGGEQKDAGEGKGKQAGISKNNRFLRIQSWL